MNADTDGGQSPNLSHKPQMAKRAGFVQWLGDRHSKSYNPLFVFQIEVIFPKVNEKNLFTKGKNADCASQSGSRH